MEFKIHGATPKTGKPICTTCKYATTILGQNMEERVLCSAGMFNNSGGIVTFKIAQCGSYHPMNVPWKHEMEQIAWIVQARRRGPSGFQIPAGEDQMEVTIKPPTRYGVPDSPTSDD